MGLEIYQWTPYWIHSVGSVQINGKLLGLRYQLIWIHLGASYARGPSRWIAYDEIPTSLHQQTHHFTPLRVLDHGSGSGSSIFRCCSNWRFCHTQMDIVVRLAIAVNLGGSEIDPLRADRPFARFGADLASPTSGGWLTYGTSLRGTNFHLLFSSHFFPGSPRSLEISSGPHFGDIEYVIQTGTNPRIGSAHGTFWPSWFHLKWEKTPGCGLVGCVSLVWRRYWVIVGHMGSFR